MEEFYPELIPQIRNKTERSSIDQNIFNIRFTPTDYKSERIQWVHYLQRYMVDKKLVIADGHIYQKREDAKYSFDIYRPKNDEGEISVDETWSASIKQFIESFSNSESPRPPSEPTQRELIKIFENTNVGKNEGRYEFPCIKINFRLIEYEDFILDIVNRCIYDIPPKTNIVIYI